jgi:hypothetical protein
VRLLVPRSWQTRTRTGTGAATTLEFAPPSGDDFKVLLTLVPPRPGGEGALKPASLRESVERAGQRALAEAVERTVQIEELAGADVGGFYFSLTDRDPGDSYQYVTQGEARLGTVLAALTILQRVASAEVKAAGLDLLRTATLAK